MTIVTFCKLIKDRVVCAAEENKSEALILRFLERYSVKVISVFHGILKKAIITSAKIPTFHFRYIVVPFQSLNHRPNLVGGAAIRDKEPSNIF